MSQKQRRNFDVNEEQRRNFDMNLEQHGGINMKRELASRNVEYQVRVTETAGPKDLSATYRSKDANDGMTLFSGLRGARAEERVDADTVNLLDELRLRFTAEVGPFKSVLGYLSWEERQILLKNIKMEHSHKLFKNQWFACGKWTHGLETGDVIVFDARLEGGRLMNPTKVTLKKASSKSGSNKFRTRGPVQLAMF